MTTSKLILLIVGTVTLIVTVFTLYIIFDTKDTSALAYLIPSLFTELSVGTAFYYNKAKKENEIKLRQRNKEDYDNLKGGE